MSIKVLLFRLLLASWCFLLGVNGFGSEKAFFDLPTLANSTSHRQDVCDRFKSFRNGTVELKDSLVGLKLNVLAMVYDGGFFNYNDEEGIDPDNPGLVAVLLDELARRAGFTWRDSFGIGRGPIGSETWDDILLWGVEAYDISADWWSLNLNRLNSGVVFIEEWYDSSIILIEKEQPEIISDKPAFWNFLRPYTFEVWLVTLMTVVVSGLVYQVLEWLSSTRGDRTLWVWFSENCYLSFINFTQAYEYKPKSTSQRIYGVSMAIWALVMTATYTANLASLLVDREVSPIQIDSIDDVRDKSNIYRICTWKDTNSDLYIEDNYPGVNRIQKDYLEEVYEGLRSGECQFAAETVASWLKYERDQTTNPTCDIRWVGEDRKVLNVAAGFAAKGDSGYLCTGHVRDVFNWHMRDMKADGFLQDAWNREYKRTQTIDCDVYRPELTAAEASNQNAEASLTTEEGPRIRRQLRHTLDSKNQIPKRHAPYTRETSRKLKGAAASAAAGGAIRYGSGADQLTINMMIGTFVFHWIFLGISILVGVVQSYWEHRNAKLERKHSSESSESASSIESTLAATRETSQQYDASSHYRDDKVHLSSHVRVNDPYMYGKSEHDISSPHQAVDEASVSAQLAAMQELMEDFKSQMRNENRHLRLKMQHILALVAEKDKCS